ncbi:hypothetical protein D3C78_1383800 [compost metagenome]
MGAANFDDIAIGFRFVAQRFMQHFQFGNQVFTHGDHRRHVHRRRKHVVGALALVNVVVRMDSALFPTHATQQFTGAVGQHFIHIHVGLGAGAGLPDRQRELVRMLVRQHFIGGADNGVGPLRRQQPQVHVHAGSGAFGQCQRMNQRGRHLFGRNAEVLQGTLRLCAP